MIVSLGVLDQDEATNGNKIKEWSSTSSRPVKIESIVESASRGREDL